MNFNVNDRGLKYLFFGLTRKSAVSARQINHIHENLLQYVQEGIFYGHIFAGSV